MKVKGLGRTHARGGAAVKGGPVHQNHLVEMGRHGPRRQQTRQAAAQDQSPLTEPFSTLRHDRSKPP